MAGEKKSTSGVHKVYKINITATIAAPEDSHDPSEAAAKVLKFAAERGMWDLEAAVVPTNTEVADV